MELLFWVVMALVLVLAWPEFVEWRAVRRFRKQFKEYENEQVRDENAGTHL